MRISRMYNVAAILFIVLLIAVPTLWASELHDAAKAGDVETMHQLLAEGYGANEADEAGNLPLHYASANGHTAIIHVLTAHGVALDATDIRGRTALQIALIAGKTDVMKALLSSGADVNAQAKTGGTALHIATILHRNDLADILIQHNADVNAIGTIEWNDGLNGTPLHWAIRLGDKSMVDLLILAGADMTIKNSRGLTPVSASRTHYNRTRNSIYFEISRLLKIRADQRKEQHSPPTPHP